MVWGFYFVPRQAKDDPLLREIQEAMKCMSSDRQVSSDEVTLAEGQKPRKAVVVDDPPKAINSG